MTQRTGKPPGRPTRLETAKGRRLAGTIVAMRVRLGDDRTAIRSIASAVGVSENTVRYYLEADAEEWVEREMREEREVSMWCRVFEAGVF